MVQTRVRVISATRGGDGDEDDDRLAVFEEELVAADEEILIQFDVDRVSRVQGRYHEPGWLERESGYLESCAWVVRVREARIEHRSIDGQSFVRSFSGFQFRRIRGAAISMTTLTVRGSDRIVLANGLRMPVNNE